MSLSGVLSAAKAETDINRKKERRIALMARV